MLPPSFDSLPSTAEPALQTHLNQHQPPVPQSVDSTTKHQNTSTARKPKPLSRQPRAFYHGTPRDSPCLGVKFDIVGILKRLDVLHPEMDFRQYEERLKSLGIDHLRTANILTTRVYQSSRVGMTEEATQLFRQFVVMDYNKALLADERRKMRVRRIASDIHAALHTVP